jgi:hypothetical protein
VAPKISGLVPIPFSGGYLKGVVYRTNPHTHWKFIRPILKLQLQTLLSQCCAKCLQICSKECMLVFMNTEHNLNICCNNEVATVKLLLLKFKWHTSNCSMVLAVSLTSSQVLQLISKLFQNRDIPWKTNTPGSKIYTTPPQTVMQKLVFI